MKLASAPVLHCSFAQIRTVGARIAGQLAAKQLKRASLGRSGGTGRGGGLKSRPCQGKFRKPAKSFGRIERIEASEGPNGQCREINSSLDAIELALSEALTAATRAQRWEVVTQIADELQARRLAKSANVVSLHSSSRRKAGEP